MIYRGWKRVLLYTWAAALPLLSSCTTRKSTKATSGIMDSSASTPSAFEIGKERELNGNGSGVGFWFDRCTVDGSSVEILQLHPYDQTSTLEALFENKPENEVNPGFDFMTPAINELGDFVKFEKTLANIDIDSALNRITIKKAVRVRKGMPDENLSIVVDRAKGEMVYLGSGETKTRTYSSCGFTSPSWNGLLKLKFDNVPFLSCEGSKPEWTAEISAFPKRKLLVTDTRGVKFDMPFLDIPEEEGGVVGYFKLEGKTLKSGAFRYGAEDAVLTLFPKSAVTRDGIQADIAITSASGKEMDSGKNCHLKPDAFEILVFN